MSIRQTPRDGSTGTPATPAVDGRTSFRATDVQPASMQATKQDRDHIIREEQRWRAGALGLSGANS